jgi:uncharacterized membrane protein YphA (DoxX/SURF4 family)
MRRLLSTDAPAATILIRIAVGGIFLTEGIQSFVIDFSLTKLPRYGFLSMIHEARTDLAMWFGLLFLLIVGAGKMYSLDAALTAAVTNRDAVR